jgi:hypothetical protein
LAFDLEKMMSTSAGVSCSRPQCLHQHMLELPKLSACMLCSMYSHLIHRMSLISYGQDPKL